MLIYLRCSLLSEDVRLRKYAEACKANNIPFNVISWDREGSGIHVEEETVFKIRAKYGRLWKNLIYKILWQFFLFYNLFRFNKSIKVVHACDFDTMLPASIFCFLTRKKLIYDVYDAISVPNPRGFFQIVIRTFEVFFINSCDLLILADKERVTQMGIKTAKNLEKLFVVENVPNLSTIKMYDLEDQLYQKYFNLSYVGVLDRHRGLENLLKFVEQNDGYFLDIAGVGTLTDLVVSFSKNCSRIRYHGFVEYNYGMFLMNRSDLIVGIYYPFTLNQRYASPNKFYESLFLGKPLLTSDDTLVGRKVIEYNTGYVIDVDYDSLLNCIKGISTYDEVYIRKSLNAKNLWEREYNNYFNNRLCKEYINTVIYLPKRP